MVGVEVQPGFKLCRHDAVYLLIRPFSFGQKQCSVEFTHSYLQLGLPPVLKLSLESLRQCHIPAAGSSVCKEPASTGPGL